MTSLLLSTPVFISRPSSSRSRESRIFKTQVTAKASNFRSKLKVVKNDRWSVAEKMNSRLAMLGYVCGSVQEKISGQNYIEQLKDNYILVLATTLLIAYSTIVTKDTVLDKEEKPFTSDIELLNGRMVMVGILLKFIYEGTTYIN